MADLIDADEKELRISYCDLKKITCGSTYTSSYQYSLAGALTQETHPSGKVIKILYDDNGDLSRIFREIGEYEKTFAYNFTYSADGKIKQLKLGNGLWETAQFNSRLQVTEFALGTTQGASNTWKANYDYGELQTNGSVDATKNSGNIAKQTVTFSGLANPFIQGYKYDALDRITEAKETVNGTQTWIQNWGYDRYGNRSSFSQNIFGYTSVSNPTISSTTNRFTSGGFTFDKNGNVTLDHNGYEYTYDGNNKQTQVVLPQGKGGIVTLGTYYYDGEGKRVKKTTHTSDDVIFVYANGKLVEERNASTNALQTSYIYAGSQLLSTETSSATNYTITDNLGSPRVIVNGSGTIVARRDFLPFGEELFADGTYRKTSDGYGTSGSDAVRQRFTGYQKDTETGLDFAEARMYQNQHGRFTAVDPLLASGKSANPQSFNRYVYVQNSPLVMVDPSGMIGDYYSNTDGHYLGSDGKKDGKVWLATAITEDATGSTIDRDSESRSSMAEVNRIRDAAIPLQPGTGEGALNPMAGAVVATARAGVTGMLKGAGNFLINNTTFGALGLIPNLQYGGEAEASYGTATQTGLGIGTGVAGGALSGASVASESVVNAGISRVFWSGSNTAKNAAAEFAASKGL